MIPESSALRGQRFGPKSAESPPARPWMGNAPSGWAGAEIAATAHVNAPMSCECTGGLPLWAELHSRKSNDFLLFPCSLPIRRRGRLSDTFNGTKRTQRRALLSSLSGKFRAPLIDGSPFYMQTPVVFCDILKRDEMSRLRTVLYRICPRRFRLWAGCGKPELCVLAADTAISHPSHTGKAPHCSAAARQSGSTGFKITRYRR